MRKVLGKIVFGVAVGCFGFVAMLFIASAFAGGANAFIGQKTGEELLELALCFIIIATGFSVPSLIYEKERLAIGLKILIHMILGTIVYLFTAFFAGWIAKDIGAVLVYTLIALGAAAVIWGIFMAAFTLQANRINKKIKEKQREQQD